MCYRPVFAPERIALPEAIALCHSNGYDLTYDDWEWSVPGTRHLLFPARVRATGRRVICEVTCHAGGTATITDVMDATVVNAMLVVCARDTGELSLWQAASPTSYRRNHAYDPFAWEGGPFAHLADPKAVTCAGELYGLEMAIAVDNVWCDLSGEVDLDLSFVTADTPIRPVHEDDQNVLVSVRAGGRRHVVLILPKNCATHTISTLETTWFPDTPTNRKLMARALAGDETVVSEALSGYDTRSFGEDAAFELYRLLSRPTAG